MKRTNYKVIALIAFSFLTSFRLNAVNVSTWVANKSGFNLDGSFWQFAGTDDNGNKIDDISDLSSVGTASQRSGVTQLQLIGQAYVDIPKGAFSQSGGFPNLIVLAVQGSASNAFEKIVNIDAGAFDYLPKMKDVALQDNEISFLPTGLFNYLVDGASSQGIRINNNPFITNISDVTDQAALNDSLANPINNLDWSNIEVNSSNNFDNVFSNPQQNNVSNNTILGMHIEPNAITTKRILDGAVTAAKLAPGSLDFSNMAGQVQPHQMPGGSGRSLQIIEGNLNFTHGFFVDYFSYVAPGAVLAWPGGGDKFVFWRSIFPCEGQLDMKGGVLELGTDLMFKGGGTLSTIGTIRSGFDVFNSGGSKEKAIVLSEQETKFPSGNSTFVTAAGADVDAIPAMVVEAPAFAHVPVSLDWSEAFQREFFFSISREESDPFVAGTLKANEKVNGNDGTFTVTNGGAVVNSNAGEGLYTSVSVSPGVDKRERKIYVATSRRPAGEGNSSLQIYSYAVNNSVATRFEEVAPVSTRLVQRHGRYEPDFSIAPTALTLENLHVYAAAWRPKPEFGPMMGHGDFEMPDQLAVAYKDTDNKYYISIYEFFKHDNRLDERDRIELLGKDAQGAFITGSGEPFENGLSWHPHGFFLSTVVKDGADGSENNVQMFGVMPHGEFEFEEFFDSTTKKHVRKARVVKVVAPQANRVLFNPEFVEVPGNFILEPFFAVSTMTDTNNLHLYRAGYDHATQQESITQIGASISVPGVSSTNPITDLSWDTRGGTLAIATQDDQVLDAAKGGIRLLNVDRQGNPDLPNILSDADEQGSAFCVQYNKAGNAFARGADDGVTKQVGVHGIQFAGGKGQEAVFEDIRLVLNSDIQFNVALRIGFDVDSFEGDDLATFKPANDDDFATRRKKFIIEGNGHTLTFTSQGKIIVPAKASLVFKDVVVEGVNSEERETGNVVSSIDLVDATSELILDNAQVIPTVSGAEFINGSIFVKGDNGQLGDTGKALNVKKSDSGGNAQLSIVGGEFKGKSKIRGQADAGAKVTIAGDTDMTGVGLTSPSALTGDGSSIVTMDAPAFPTETKVDVKTIADIPDAQVATGDDAFSKQPTSMAKSMDQTDPLYAIANEGDTVGEVAIEIQDKSTNKMVKVATLTCITGKVKDVVFKPNNPKEIPVGNATCDRHYVAVVEDLAGNGSKVEFHAIDIDQEVYKTDLYNGAQDYTGIRSNSRVTTLCAGEGTGAAQHSATAKLEFTDKKIEAVAIHPLGKEIAVVCNDSGTRTLRIYPLRKDASIVTESTKVATITCDEPSSKDSPLQYTASGDKLVLSAKRSGNTGKLQTFKKDGTTLTNVSNVNLDTEAAIAANPVYSGTVLVTTDNAAVGVSKGLSLYKVQDDGSIKENVSSAISMPAVTVNAVAWNSDGAGFNCCTDDGVKLGTQNVGEGVIKPNFVSGAALGEGTNVKVCVFSNDAKTLVKDNATDVGVHPLPPKRDGGISSMGLEFQKDMVISSDFKATGDCSISSKNKKLIIPRCSNLTIASNVKTQIKNTTIECQGSTRKAIAETDANGNQIGNSKILVNQPNIHFENSESTCTCENVTINAPDDIDFAESCKFEVKGSNIKTNVRITVPGGGETQVVSEDGFGIVGDGTLGSGGVVADSQNKVNKDKQKTANLEQKQIIKSGEDSEFGAETVGGMKAGQTLKLKFEKGKDGARPIVILTGSTDADNPQEYNMQDYSEIAGTKLGDIQVEPGTHVKLVGSTVAAEGKAEGTGVCVGTGARFCVPATSSVTLTGNCSLTADAGGEILNEGTICCGTAATAATDKCILKVNGGNLTNKGTIALAYGDNTFDVQPGGTCDCSEPGNKIYINKDENGALTDVSNTAISFQDCKMIAPVASSATPVMEVGPNQIVDDVENERSCIMKGVQGEGLNVQYETADGVEMPVATISPADDMNESGTMGAEVVKMTQDHLPKPGQVNNPVTHDATGDVHVLSKDCTFEYGIKKFGEPNPNTVMMASDAEGEIVMWQNQDGTAHSQRKNQAAV